MQEEDTIITGEVHALRNAKPDEYIILKLEDKKAVDAFLDQLSFVTVSELANVTSEPIDEAGWKVIMRGFGWREGTLFKGDDRKREIAWVRQNSMAPIEFDPAESTDQQADFDEATHQNLVAEIATLNERLEKAQELSNNLAKLMQIEGRISNALLTRLDDVLAKKLALAVAHGDIPPQQYEQRRQVEMRGVRELITQVRVQAQKEQD